MSCWLVIWSSWAILFTSSRVVCLLLFSIRGADFFRLTTTCSLSSSEAVSSTSSTVVLFGIVFGGRRGFAFFTFSMAFCCLMMGFWRGIVLIFADGFGVWVVVLFLDVLRMIVSISLSVSLSNSLSFILTCFCLFVSFFAVDVTSA